MRPPPSFNLFVLVPYVLVRLMTKTCLNSVIGNLFVCFFLTKKNIFSVDFRLEEIELGCPIPKLMIINILFFSVEEENFDN